MPTFNIHRMKDNPRQQFRWVPHLSGASAVKPRDYEEAEAVQASSLYAAWNALRQTPEPLRVGDLLVSDNGDLHIVKYVGFEAADWVTPDQAASAPYSISLP